MRRCTKQRCARDIPSEASGVARLVGSRARETSQVVRADELHGDDNNWSALIAELDQLATAPVAKGKRDPKPIDQVLGDIIALTYDRAREIAEPNRMAGLEL